MRPPGRAGGREAGHRPRRAHPCRGLRGPRPARRTDRAARPHLRLPLVRTPGPGLREGPRDRPRTRRTRPVQREHRPAVQATSPTQDPRAAGWTYTALEPGTYLWTSPHGYQFLRDHTGTIDVSTRPRRRRPTTSSTAQHPADTRPRRGLRHAHDGWEGDRRLAVPSHRAEGATATAEGPSAIERGTGEPVTWPSAESLTGAAAPARRRVHRPGDHGDARGASVAERSWPSEARRRWARLTVHRRSRLLSDPASRPRPEPVTMCGGSPSRAGAVTARRPELGRRIMEAARLCKGPRVLPLFAGTSPLRISSSGKGPARSGSRAWARSGDDDSP